MTTLTAALQVASLAVYGLIFILSLVIGWRHEDTRGLLLFPLLWTGTGVAFYLLVLTGRVVGDALLLVGAMHRLMGGLMLLIGLLALWAVVNAPPADYVGGEGDES